VWAALELVLGEPQPFKGLEVHEVEAVATIHECFSDPRYLNQRVNSEGKPSSLRGAIQVVRLIKSDQGFTL
jgi:hypothetical protein